MERSGVGDEMLKEEREFLAQDCILQVDTINN